MRSRRLILTVGLLVAVLTACHGLVSRQRQLPSEKHQVGPRAVGTTLRVASFNILTSGNKKFPWESRRRAVAECLRDMDPDVFGLQEVVWGQLKDLVDAFPNYTCIGRARDDGHLGGEFVPLFFRTTRFVLKDAEVFWLSETPEVAGSNQWRGACIRCATVAILIDRTNRAPLGVLNTHFDHVSATARENSAQLIRKRLPTYGKGLPWIVTGDFNTAPGSPPYLTLVGSVADEPLLTDTFAAIHRSAPPETTSFHGYTNVAKPQRIDWILAGPQYRPLAAGINQFKYPDRFPSDHFAVWADLKWDEREYRDRGGLPTETTDEH